jgi:hypothetical protein
VAEAFLLRQQPSALPLAACCPKDNVATHARLLDAQNETTERSHADWHKTCLEPNDHLSISTCPQTSDRNRTRNTLSSRNTPSNAPATQRNWQVEACKPNTEARCSNSTCCQDFSAQLQLKTPSAKKACSQHAHAEPKQMPASAKVHLQNRRHPPTVSDRSSLSSIPHWMRRQLQPGDACSQG